MQEVPHSVRGHTHEANVVLTISGHELLFRSLDIMVRNDYGFRGCMMNILIRLWIHIHHNKLQVLSLTPRAQAGAKID